MSIVSKIFGIINGTNPANPTNGKRVLFAKSDGWYDKNSAGVTAKLATTSDISAPYLVYTALLTQSGTSAPVATVLENTLGGTVVWSYTSSGIYAATLSGVFTENKTWTQPDNNAGYYFTNLSLYITMTRIDNNSLQIMWNDESDNGFSNLEVEIRVYQQ